METNHINPVPLEAQYLYRRGQEMMGQKKEDAALILLRQAVFIAPGFSKAYQELGNCLVLLGRPAEASVYYLKASRIDPVRCGAPVDCIATKARSEDQSFPGSSLTCLIW